MNAIVTGGAGFIGSHLCSALLDQGISVTCIDNLTTGVCRNIASLMGRPGFRLVEHDAVQPFEPSERPDLIFHLASPASVVDYLNRPLETWQVNTTGTLHMLELARTCGARFLYTSTSEVYGDPLMHPQSEEYWGNVNPNGLRACYDEGKRAGEAITLVYWRSLGVDVRIVRIFNTYGPHSRPDDGRIVPNFITQALRGEPLTIYGDGSQTRSYCYVSDLVTGILAAMFSERTTGEVFNLGNPDECTVLEFAEMIARHVESTAGFVYCPLPEDDPSRRRPDIGKARTMLAWTPQVTLSEGIMRTVEWFRQILDETPAPH